MDLQRVQSMLISRSVIKRIIFVKYFCVRMNKGNKIVFDLKLRSCTPVFLIILAYMVLRDYNIKRTGLKGALVSLI